MSDFHALTLLSSDEGAILALDDYNRSSWGLLRRHPVGCLVGEGIALIILVLLSVVVTAWLWLPTLVFALVCGIVHLSYQRQRTITYEPGRVVMSGTEDELKDLLTQIATSVWDEDWHFVTVPISTGVTMFAEPHGGAVSGCAEDWQHVIDAIAGRVCGAQTDHSHDDEWLALLREAVTMDAHSEAVNRRLFNTSVGTSLPRLSLGLLSPDIDTMTTVVEKYAAMVAPAKEMIEVEWRTSVVDVTR